MGIKLLPRLFFIISLITICCTVKAQSANAGDVILGRWTSADSKLTVEVYKDGNIYKAKIVWYKNEDTSKAMGEWTDKHNPDKTLRDRKILGMTVVNDLIYQPKSKSWEHGTIYDAKSGKTYDASASLDKGGLLKVIGYWHLKFIGRTMMFKKAV